jgi:hypothetical protein
MERNPLRTKQLIETEEFIQMEKQLLQEESYEREMIERSSKLLGRVEDTLMRTREIFEEIISTLPIKNADITLQRLEDWLSVIGSSTEELKKLKHAHPIEEKISAPGTPNYLNNSITEYMNSDLPPFSKNWDRYLTSPGSRSSTITNPPRSILKSSRAATHSSKLSTPKTPPISKAPSSVITKIPKVQIPVVKKVQQDDHLEFRHLNTIESNPITRDRPKKRELQEEYFDEDSIHNPKNKHLLGIWSDIKMQEGLLCIHLNKLQIHFTPDQEENQFDADGLVWRKWKKK